MIGDNHVQFGGGRSAERRSRPTLLFFMVEKNYIFKFKSQFACAFSYSTPLSVGKVKIGKINDDSDNVLTISNNNNNNNNKNQDNKDPEDSKYKYVKVLVNDPFNNRDIILKVTKQQKGVYVWASLDGKHVYVGHSINLYNRISSGLVFTHFNSALRRSYNFRSFSTHSFSPSTKQAIRDSYTLLNP